MTGGTIRVDGLRVSFPGVNEQRSGRLVALGGLDLAVGGGEVVALVGPNGCGKSTLLRAIAGLIAHDAGQVTIDGAPIDAPDARVGLVFQEPRLLPWRTAADNVTYPLELARWPADRRTARLAELVDRVGLEAAALGARPSALSGGTRQRVALARALALEPEVLLLDEPFSALDALTRERFDLELRRVWERNGGTVVLVTHSIAEAILVADRLVVLSARPGRVVADLAVGLPGARSLASLEDARVGPLTREVRRQLGEGAA